MTFLILALLSGIFFGIYYNVLVVAPATLTLAVTCCVVAFFDTENAVSSASLIMVCSVAVQGGYMIGLTSRDILAPLLARSESGRS